jgi:pimeloyl-ACP methyl ester carboxylesterase
MDLPGAPATAMDRYLAEHVIRVGRGEPMLLVHGIGHRKEGWDPVLPGLAGRYDVAAIDLPGFGGADPLPDRPTDEALADWCERVLDELGWDTAHLVGNSLGGLIALRLAGRGRARTVTALSPGGKMVGWEQRWAKALLRTMRAAAPLAARVPALADRAATRQAVLGIIFGRPAAVTPAYARLSTAGLATATAFEATLDAATWCIEDLKPIDAAVPVTIAWGTRDVLLWPWQGQRWKADVPHARLIRLAGLGHTPMPDDPDLVVDVIARTAR